MFGYVRPLSENLKVKEYYRFKACYCGLCGSLKRNFGFASRFILNYDFVFLAMLLWNEADGVEYEFKRCAASPCRRKCICKGNTAFDECAAKSVILSWWKLRDDERDEKLLKRAAASMAKMLLGKAYRKAKAMYPGFDEETAAHLAELDKIEREGGATLDEAADKFAQLLSRIALSAENGTKSRILAQIFYHTGRFVYIIDAVDDLKDDVYAGRYNPVAKKYSLTEGKLSPEQEDELRTTLGNSFHIIASDFELLPETKWSEILRNIIREGMPAVSDKVFRGTFRNTRAGFAGDRKINIGEMNE